ncbi:unnamed protein product [Polarella glacialis]|uniref:Uncharacterized protein n=1 Tax=Polarella glacialis TaxID=89957 RepID=A0A813FUA2_POLGL|nr:unnamed protein product [Polarella glacialis]
MLSPYAYKPKNVPENATVDSLASCCEQTCSLAAVSEEFSDAEKAHSFGLASLSTAWAGADSIVELVWQVAMASEPQYIRFRSTTNPFVDRSGTQIGAKLDTQLFMLSDFTTNVQNLTNMVTNAGGAYLCFSSMDASAETAWAILPMSNAAWELGCSGTANSGKGAYYSLGLTAADGNGWVGFRDEGFGIRVGGCIIPWGTVPGVSTPSHASCQVTDSVGDVRATLNGVGSNMSCSKIGGVRLDGSGSYLAVCRLTSLQKTTTTKS